MVAASAFAHCPLIAWLSVKSVLTSFARVLPLTSTDWQVSVPCRLCSTSGLVEEELAHPARAATTAAQAAKVRGLLRLAPVISKSASASLFTPSDKTRSRPAMVRTADDCYRDETVCDGTVTADQRRDGRLLDGRSAGQRRRRRDAGREGRRGRRRRGGAGARG